MSASNTPENIQDLAKKWREGTITSAEKLEFDNWYNSFNDALLDAAGNETPEQLKERIYQAIITKEEIIPMRKSVKFWPRIAVAAAAVAAITLGTWIYMDEVASSRNAPRHDLTQNDIAPGKNGATITLANGKVIALSDAKSGVVVGNDLKYSDGSALSGLQPSLPGGERSMALTASTAKGQTYQFTLADGTKVWLNADSKLEFPSKFVDSKTRFVKLTGEGYFEVVKDKAHPFIVQTDEQEVEVLGTHFNINSYADEGSVKTTLLEGSVRVNDVILKPNQQSVLTTSKRIQVKDVDVSEAVAWKNGLFSFNNAPMQTVMRQIARWYNVEVEYESEDLKNKLLDGSVSRYDKVSGILNAITQTGAAKFKIEGKTIKVIK